jgi:uncharacterized alpha-E superfamily protein
MLSRDADSMYWMSRYVERAEHVARLLLVNSNLLIDVGDLAPALQQRQWLSVSTIMRLPPPPDGDAPLGQRVAEFMTFDQNSPSSLISCIAQARENARAIRESISSEMWENLNALYWNIHGGDARTQFEESPDQFYRSIMTGSMLFQGLTDQTLPHDQRWLFTQIGKYFERIDVTARVLETKFNILKDAEAFLETPLRNIHWMAVLRSCCSIEAYRRSYLGDLDPLRVASYLILHRNFPRSIQYCVSQAFSAMQELRLSVSPLSLDPGERILGRLNAQLEYAEMSEILVDGLPKYLQSVQQRIADAAAAVQQGYFLY